MPSVVIAAHNEEALIGDSLTALIGQRTEQPIQIVVSANGCVDGTARIAESFGVVVVDRPEPSKTAALNAGEREARGFPRIFMDADIVLPSDGVQALVDRFAQPDAPLTVVPRRRIDSDGRPLLVRAYISVNERLPVFSKSLFGRGVIAVSEKGRSRFDEFPDLISDDLFLDGLFDISEKGVAESVEVVIQAPLTTRDLIRRLVRVRRGNSQLHAARAAGTVRGRAGGSDRWSWLRDVVLPNPRLLPAAVPYVLITTLAGVLAKLPQGSRNAWGRDESTRGVELQSKPNGGD